MSASIDCNDHATAPNIPNDIFGRVPTVSTEGQTQEPKEEVDHVICWLTGYDQAELQRQIERESDLETFFANAPLFHPNASLIKGVVCSVCVEDIEDHSGGRCGTSTSSLMNSRKALDTILRQ